ncbi:MAG: hypothetical protein ACI4RV_08195, partial [Eubacteriales bacterium]
MKKLTVFALSVLLVLTAFAASALELENVQQAQEQALPEQPAALTAAAPVPGLNIFTGTVNPVDFENGSNLGSWWIADATTVNRDVVDNAQQQAGTGNSTKVLRLTAQSVKEYFRTISNNYALFTGRRYEFKLDTHIENFRDSGDLRMNIQQITTAESPSNSYYQSNDAAWKAAEKERKWHTQTLNFTVLNGTGTDLRIQWRVSNGTAVSNVTVYMDNISVIPYYNITYKIPSGDKVEYALRDEEGNLLT